MDKQSMLNDYIDAKGFKQIMAAENLQVSIAVRLNLEKAKLYKRHHSEFITHVGSELLINQALEADQQRNYYVWNAIEVARFEAKHGVDLINNYADYVNYIANQYGSLSNATLNELKLMVLMENYQTMLMKYRNNVLK